MTAPDFPWHAMQAADVLARLGVDPLRGLDSAEAARRLAAHGPNALPEPPPRPPWLTFVRQFKSPLIYILFVAAALAVALGHRGDALVILAVVVVNAVIGAVQEGRAERSMAALRRLSALQVRVRRDGAERPLPARDLVAGDILVLAAGDAVGADARLIDQARLEVAEAALTGESVPVAKAVAPVCEATGLADRHGMVYSGTYATAGRGVAAVVAIGRDTEVGRMARLAESGPPPRTPLELRLDAFGRALLFGALALFVSVVVLGLWRALPMADVLMIAISQMVSMVPEGLPVAMTIALAIGMQRMAARGAVVRRLAAVETLGSTTVICTDKTGTLTRNEMTVRELWLPDGRSVAVDGVGYAPAGDLSCGGAPLARGDVAVAALVRAAVLCNDAQLRPPQDGQGAWGVVGDPTEAALLVLAAKAGVDADALRRAAPRTAELPFDSDRKLMATRHGTTASRVVVKGAPEAVLPLCGDAAAVRCAREAADAMAGRALRVLAFAELDDADLDAGFDPMGGRARLLGLAGQIDPPRSSARDAVARCAAAGIRPVMVTGDHKLTGLAIARELGIAREGDAAVDGQALERMNDVELQAAVDRIAVYARVHPAQKVRIVQALQTRGDVVAMTGDGVNDAPALARADVGVAMGMTGTEVAKSASEIVVTDDDFATIVEAVEQGRVVYANLKKLILFLFVTSVDEVIVLLAALMAGLPLPLAAVQILWINIVTEGTLTLNLVMEPPGGDEMKRPPVARDDALIGRDLLGRMAVMAPAAAAATFGWFWWRLGQGVALDLVRTETFTVLVMCQWFNVLNCRSATRSAIGSSLLRNPWLLGGLALSVALQLAVLYAPPLNAMFHTVPLAPAQLLPMAAAASVVLWAEEARKAIVRRRR